MYNESNMEAYQLSKKFLSTTKSFWFSHNVEKKYNEIVINPNKSFQLTETAMFEFPRFNFLVIYDRFVYCNHFNFKEVLKTIFDEL